jgi:hypothetical protein
MTSRILNLDIVNPRGWGEMGQTGDACEHGHQLTETDIENLKKHCGLKISHHTINGNKYKLISLLQKDATDTVISILGGDGKYYVIDSNDIPNGLIMPFAEYCKIKKLNLVIVDPDHPLEHAWQARIIPLKIKDKKIRVEDSVTRSRFEKLLKLAREFYIKKHKNLSEDFFSQNKILHDVHIFIKDLEKILEYIKNTTNTNIWLMGHCSSAVMISFIYDTNQYNHLYKGIIFLNPWWKKMWRETGLDEMKYFLTKVTKPILIIQHAEDPCVGTHPKIAKKIISDINGPLTRYSELNGGIDQGCPHFSMGYHGFRGIEHKVIDEIDNFILDHSKI